MKRNILTLSQTNGNPPITTHNLVNEQNDLIISHLKRKNLTNNKDDKVKVIFHAEFINPTNPLFDNISYNDMLRGCHLGVFASFYE